MGRENFGTNLERQRKGIADGVKINDHRQFGYKIYPLPLDETQINKVDFSGEYSEWVPAFYKFEFEACNVTIEVRPQKNKKEKVIEIC